MADNTFKKYIGYILRLVFSGCVVYFILKSVSVSSIYAHISKLNPPLFFLAFLMILAGGIPSAYAWYLLLKAQKIQASPLYLIYLNLIGFFFNSYLPTGVGGDFWRGYTMAKGGNQNPYGGIVSVIAERYVAFASIVCIGILSLLCNWKRLASVNMLSSVGSIIGGITLVFITGSGITILFLKKKNWQNKTLAGMPLSKISAPLSIYMNSPLLLLKAMLITALSPLFEIFAYILIIKALGLDVSVLSVFTAVPILRFLNHVPVSINSIGVQDVALILYLKPMGLGKSEAVSISFMMHILRLMVGLVGASLYVFFHTPKNTDT